MNNEIIQKLNLFIKSYYKNLVLRGIIYSVILLVVCFVGLNIVEFFGWQSSIIRTIIFYTFIVLTIFVLFIWVVIPIGKLFSIGKTLSYSQAAKIIGDHFPDIQDKLLNFLQLQEQYNEEENSLLKAAIEQKTEKLSPIPFNKAIDTKKTKKFSKYLIFLFALLGIILMLFPRLLFEPTARYINHNAFYEKPAPFTFRLKEERMHAVQQSDYTIEVSIEGKMLPDKTNIWVDGQSFEMKKIDKSHYKYTIHQIQKTTIVQFEAADVKSKPYTVEVNPKPILTDLKAKIIYPAYTQIKPEEINNITNLSLPKGTKIHWFLKTKDTETILFQTNSNLTTISPKGASCDFVSTYTSSQNICIKTKNTYTLSSDSIAFSINVIEDERPQIAVIEEKDSTLTDRIFFRGQIKDDYGFTKLEFHLKVTLKGSENTTVYKKKLTLNTSESAQEFYHFTDLSEYKINPGDRIEYYFEVWDNDGINGAKSTKSQSFNIVVPTEQEIDEKIQSNAKDVKQEADKAINELKKLQQQINELTKKLAEKKELSWQDKKDLEQLKEKQQQIKEKVSDIQQKMQENSMMEEKYSNIDEELLQKQMEIEKLFKQLENEDLNKLIEQLNELTEKSLNKDKVNEALQDIKNKNEELSKELDRNLELYKRLDVEKDINNAIDKLNELSKKEKELSKETKQAKDKASKDALQKKQDEINKQFQDLQKKMEEIKKKDAQLEDSFNFKIDKEKENNIKKDLQQAQENLDKGKNKDAAKNQESAAQKMQEMADSMEQNQQENEDEQLGEDIDNIRQILKNLVTLSKEEENLIYLSQKTAVSDPSYQNLINKQNTIKESMKDITDSLYNISKRQPQVSKTIFEETYKVRENIEKSLSTLLKFNQSHYNSFRNNQAANSQQYAMASMNNLSLLLAESLNNMNNQKQANSNKKNGKPSKSCKNPGQGNKPNIKSMKQMQEALNKEIQRLQKELEKQGTPQKHKIGENSKLNEELAKAAAQQEMIRKMMQEYVNQLKQENAKSAGGESKALKQMEQTEQEIVNKKINANTIKRQNEILTRMLESERAEKKKDKDKERKSQTGVDRKQENIENFEAFKKLKNRDLELIKKIPPVYSSYYKLKVSEYFYNFEDSKQNKKQTTKP